ncbi:general substrate transporter [Radiomyces spectabilis]|uniref:general substrate transporter n=1 Tax=Radiomyces spectabilis TaxID=64574 RepID=UPI00221F26CC|nr:general substrate transporter [Radiomyces spectabilis]KAI8374737.1 general substrate transporter [Radiomyces spectabilis]
MDADKDKSADDAIVLPHEDITLIAEQRREPTLFVYVLVFCVCVGGFLFGYDTGVISGALGPLQDDFHMSTVNKELVVGGTTFGAIFGGFFAGLLSDRFGRKLLVIISSVVFIAGALLLALANSYGLLLFGRLVVGLGVGIASMIVPVYVSELAPKHIRGRLTTLNTLVITFGQVIAYVINIAFTRVPSGWRYMFGLAGVPALFQFIIMPFLPESPRRLVAIGKIDKARSALRKIYGASTSESFIENEIAAIDNDIRLCKSGTFRDLFTRQNLRPLIIACILQAAQQLSGFNAAMYYAATILQMAGFRSNEGSTSVAIIVSATNMVFTAIAVMIIDKAGRRRMLVITMLTMIAGLIALGATFAAQQGFIPKQDSCSAYVTHCSRCVLDPDCGWSISQDTCVNLNLNPSDIFQSASGCPARGNDKAITGVLLTSLIVYVASYALGLGYAPWLVQSEMFDMSVRGKANGVSTAVNWICNLIISTTFLSMTDTMTTAGTFWFYAGISFILWLLVYFLVPETAGKSLEEINATFKS